MLKILQQTSRWLASNASFFIIAVAVFTFLIPGVFGWVRGNTQTIILGMIMLTMGLTLTTDDFRILARRPLDILVGACAQFLIMPCVAWLLVRVFRLELALALGILLVGCCPGGVSSNIMSFPRMALHTTANWREANLTARERRHSRRFSIYPR